MCGQVGVRAGQALPEKVKIVEVGPRDGLQNEKVTLFFKEKYAFSQQTSQSSVKTAPAEQVHSSRVVSLFFSGPHLLALLLSPSDNRSDRDKNPPDRPAVSLGAAGHRGHQLRIPEMGSAGGFLLPEQVTRTVLTHLHSDVRVFDCRWQTRWR